MKLYNTLTRKIELFTPAHDRKITLYSCGPTVYDYTHIGHARTYTNTDVLKRTLVSFGYKVKHVMNITDVGHLTGDDDTGEDKLEEGAKRIGKSVWDVAKAYTDFFLKTLIELNIIIPDQLVKATNHVKEMTQLIKQLSQEGFAYETGEAVYFDVTRFKNYGKLSRQPLEEKIQKARKEVYVDPQKRNPADFALWFKRVGRFSSHTMHWDSPWGDGFPGWHIECSVMSMKYLGETIDIHTGGVDHLSVHHENEIAQSESATGKPFVRFWFHNEFLLVEGQKMSKSLGNIYTVDDVVKKGIEPAALRLLYLQTHYRKQLNFTWEAARAAQEAYNRLKEYVIALCKETQRTTLSAEKLKQIDSYRQKFADAIANDLQMPQALAVMWDALKSNIPATDKLDLVVNFDQVLGLKLKDIKEEKIPKEILDLAKKRVQARKQNDFETADLLRKEIQRKGYRIEDTEDSFVLKPKPKIPLQK
ncbi:cysteine--tRNA ligase [Candidatus Roizmanbacteria bacterium]|nr:cysteine--tRNA ligase [Candidatus Roizmanbacteria bacterium]